MLIRLSEWLPRIAEAGFDGLELFEPHYLGASPEEQNQITRAPLPIAIFNSYCTLDAAGQPHRAALLGAVPQSGARAFKFNFGKDSATLKEEISHLLELLAELPAEVEAWCECHPGTSLETPQAAAAALLPLDNRVKVIIHPFTTPIRQLEEWMQLFGNRVAHSHVQMRDPADNSRFVSVGAFPEECLERLQLLYRHGYAGSFSIEFVEGTTGQNNENPEELFRAAVRERDLLRNFWHQASQGT